MAANIFGDRFAGNREPAWHQLGTVFQPGDIKTAQEGFAFAGIDYEIKKVPLYFRDPATNAEIESQNVAVLRSPTAGDNIWRQIASVDKDFGILQHQEIARVLDEGGLTTKWPVETIGALGKGETVFISLRETPYDVAGDQINRFFLVSNGNDGKHGLHIAVAHIRVVCQNTLTAALNDAIVHVTFSHHANVAADLQSYTQLISQLEDAQAHVTGVMQHLATVTLSEIQAKQVIQAAFREPTVPQGVKLLQAYGLATSQTSIDASAIEKWEDAQKHYELAREQQARLRMATWEQLQKLNDENKLIAMSAWAVINAVAEVEDCRESGKRGGEKAAMESRLWGRRMAEYNDAFKVAAKFANVK